MNDYEVRPFEPGDIDAVVDLYEHLSRGDRDHRRRYFEWKYLENPFIQPPIMMLAHLDGACAGMRGVYGSSWRDARTGASIVIPHADDLAIHPDHRNRGLFLPLMDALTEAAAHRGYPWIIGLAGGLTTQKLALATGWTSLGEIDRHERGPTSVFARLPRSRSVRRAKNLGRRVLGRPRRTTSRLLPNQSDVDALVAMIAASSESASIQDRDFIEEIGSLADASEYGGEARISAARDARYLKWRLGNPSRTYRIVSWDDGGSRGYVILAWPGADVETVIVADYAFTDQHAFEGLLRAICSVKRLQVMMMTVQLPPPRMDFLTGLGFLPLLAVASKARKRRFLLTGTSCNGMDGSFDPGSSTLGDWDFNLLETMQV